MYIHTPSYSFLLTHNSFCSIHSALHSLFPSHAIPYSLLSSNFRRRVEAMFCAEILWHCSVTATVQTGKEGGPYKGAATKGLYEVPS